MFLTGKRWFLNKNPPYLCRQAEPVTIDLFDPCNYLYDDIIGLHQKCN